MQNTRETRTSNGGVGGRGQKSKKGSKKKRSSLAVTTSHHPEVPLSSANCSRKARRKSLPDEWDPMDCNFRVDTTRERGHYQKTEIKMPEIHHGIATSSMPIPLNTIMKGWDNVPKLYRYPPSELEVIYHRRTGETETLVSPEPEKPPEGGDFKVFSNHLVPVSPLPLQPCPSIPPTASTISELSEFRGASAVKMASADDLLKPESIPSSAADDEQLGVTLQLYDNDGKQKIFPILQSNEDRIYATVESQTPEQISTSTSTSCQTEAIVNQKSQGTCTTILCSRTSDSETQTTSISGSAININPTPIGNCSNKYQSRASQTETEPITLLSNLSSQSTSIPTQTEPEPKNEIFDKAVGTEKVSLSATSVQVDLKVQPPSEECGSQTEIDIETPQMCLMCDFKQLEIQELEENMTELQERFRMTEMQLEVLKTKEEQTKIIIEKPEVEFNDVGTNIEEGELFSILSLEPTPNEVPLFSPLLKFNSAPPMTPETETDHRLKCRELQSENERHKETIQSLRAQLNSFQSGLKRLRTAIEKPVTGDSNVSDAAIQQVLYKADDFIMNCTNSQTRAAKINNHLTVLNACVNVANDILEETLPSPQMPYNKYNIQSPK